MASVKASEATGPQAVVHHISAAFAQKWWAVASRGLLAILFGLIALVFPGVTMLSLVYVFGAYAVLDGVLAIVSALRAARSHRHWGMLILEGVAGIVAGVIAWVWPGISLAAFILLIGIWALVSGLLMFRGAFTLHISHGRWWLLLAGVSSMVFGGMLIASPLVGAVVLTWWVGAYAILFGVALLIVAFRLRARMTEQPVPAGRKRAARKPTKP